MIGGVGNRVAFVEDRPELRIRTQQLSALHGGLGKGGRAARDEAAPDQRVEGIGNQLRQRRAEAEILVRNLVHLSGIPGWKTDPGAPGVSDLQDRLSRQLLL